MSNQVLDFMCFELKAIYAATAKNKKVIGA